MTRLRFLVLLALVPAPASAQSLFNGARAWPFVVSSVGEDYPFTVALRGQYRIFAESLVVDVSEGWAVSQIPGSFGTEGKATEVTLTALTGRGTPESWNAERTSNALPVAPLLMTGQRVPVPPMHFVIAPIDTTVLADRWLAFRLGVDQHLPIKGFQPGLLVSYACTEEYILGATPASRLRAKAQRRDYATVC